MLKRSRPRSTAFVMFGTHITQFFRWSRSLAFCGAIYGGALLGSALALSTPLHAQSVNTPAVIPKDAYALRVPGVVYAQFREGYIPRTEGSIRLDAVSRILTEIGATRVEPFDAVAYRDSISHALGIDRIYVITYSSGAHPLGVVSRLLQTGLVQSASPRYIFKLQTAAGGEVGGASAAGTPLSGAPNDPGYSTQYYMQSIQIEKAWDITQGDSNVVVADVDAGVNYNHEDLAANIKYNAGEIGLDAQGHDKRTNGIDDDGDGAVDNWRGWDAAGETTGNILAPDNDPYPEDIQWYGAAHGTMTSGCFGAVANNRLGIAGVAPNSKILAVKIGNAHEQLTGAYEGVHYAAAHGAKVINCSWGGLVDNEALPFAEIFPQEITARGEVMVAAAGNYSINNDVQHFYPAYIGDVLAVGATGPDDKPTSFTHYGHSVDVFAPGKAINTTTYPGNEYDTPDGTSFSAPITSAIVALVMAKNPLLSPKAVQRRIIETCDDVMGKDRWLWWGRVNAFAALNSPGHPALEITALNVQGGGALDKVDVSSGISVYFKNFAAPGSNVFATLQPGPGYTWTNFDPLHNQNWPRSLIGTIDSQATASASYQIIRTGQISEGSLPLTFFTQDGSGYTDTLHYNVPVTPKDGMKRKMPAPHATAIKQVDATAGWAGFGYFIRVHDPETGRDSIILVSQYSRRNPDGTWTSPEDIASGFYPVSAMDAIDGDRAWFGGSAPGGGSPTVLYTDDGGGSWSTTDVSGVTNTIHTIHFFDRAHGILVGDAAGSKFQVATTTDGGGSWSGIPTAVAASSGEKSFDNAAFWNGAKGWFGTSNREVLYTTDNGSSWHNTTTFSGSTPKEKNVMAIAFSGDDKLGYAAIRPYGSAADSAGLYTSANGGVTWSMVTRPDPGLIPYAVAFLPGTTTAIVTTNMGVYKLTSPTAKWTYLGVPSDWDPRNSVVSAGGTSSAYTISAGSDASGVVDYSVGDAAVQGTSGTVTLATSIAPNPASGTATLYFSMPRTERVTLEVRDVLGRTVLQIFEGSLTEGQQTVPFSTSTIAAGVYHVVLRTESGEISDQRLVVLR